MGLTIGILGPVEVHRDGQPVRLPTRQVGRLLTALAAWPDHDVPVATLVTGLWGADPPSTAANTLQVHVSNLRRAIGREVVRTVPGGYRLALPADAVDERVFIDRLEQADAAVRRGHRGQARHGYAAALALWRGEPYDGLLDPRLRARRERLVGLKDDAEEELLACRLELARTPLDLATVAVDAAALLAEQPLRERRHVLQIRALAAAGRTGEAVTAYRQATAVLREELGLDPGPDLVATYAALLRQDGSLTPLAGRGRVVIPRALTDLVDRDDEVAAVTTALLDDAVALVTLAGPPGVGASRLTQAVAAGLPDNMLGGVVVVELTRVDEAMPLLDAVAANLRIRGTTPATARLIAGWLGDEPALLVVDGVRGADDVAAVVDLLRTHPRLSVLATATAPLGIPGERVVRLAGLTVPAPGTAPDEVWASPAVRLFVDRARTAGVVLARADAASVAALCRAVDGLPLALEVLAAQAAEIPLGDLVARIGGATPAAPTPPAAPAGPAPVPAAGPLAAADPSAPAGVETGRLDAIEAAVAGLEPAARVLLLAAGQLPGGLSATTRARLLGDPGRTRAATAQLLDRRLAEVGPDERLTVSAAVRQVAGQLPADEERDALRRRLRTLLARLRAAARLGPDPFPPGHVEAQLIRDEASNVRAALAWPLPWGSGAQHAELALLAAAAVLTGAARGPSQHLIADALAEADLDGQTRLDLLCAMGSTCELADRFAEAEGAFRRMAEVADAVGDADARRSAWVRLAAVQLDRAGDCESALDALEGAGTDPRVLALVRAARAQPGPSVGAELAAALPTLPAADPTAAGRVASRVTAALLERRVLLSCAAQRDLATAVPALRRTLADAAEVDVGRPQATVLSVAGTVFASLGLTDETRDATGRLRAVGEQWGDPTMLSMADFNEGLLAFVRADLLTAVDRTLEALDLASRAATPRLIRYCLYVLALMAEAWAAGRPDPEPASALAGDLIRAAVAAVPTDPTGSGVVGLPAAVARLAGPGAGPDVLDDLTIERLAARVRDLLLSAPAAQPPPAPA